jgi:hypothetical protein
LFDAARSEHQALHAVRAVDGGKPLQYLQEYEESGSAFASLLYEEEQACGTASVV